MKNKSVRILVLAAVASLVLIGVSALSTPVEADQCGPGPIICPAIGVICLPGPSGQPRKACRLNPCSCKFTCVPADHPCTG